MGVLLCFGIRNSYCGRQTRYLCRRKASTASLPLVRQVEADIPRSNKPPKKLPCFVLAYTEPRRRYEGPDELRPRGHGITRWRRQGEKYVCVGGLE